MNLTEEKKNCVMFEWEKPNPVYDQPVFEDRGPDARLGRPGTFGCQYARMVFLQDGTWLSVYTIYDNNGYLAEADGGTRLQFSVSSDRGKTWSVRSVLKHPSRDLDNGQMLVLENGDILLSCRSVRWQESYMLPVYRSQDGGKTWEFCSVIDERHGAPGSLGNPDKGMYEPHLYRLDDGRIGVMYANEKHVTENPWYSQIISQRISEDEGRTWGEEIWVAWDCARPQLRPGMPVWRRMQDGRYMVVFEVVELVLTCLKSAWIHYKISDDGIHWNPGIGTRIMDQSGGPFLEVLSNGWLVVTSLSGRISISKDAGKSWSPVEPLPFPSHMWPALYALEDNRILLMNSCARECGGEQISVCVGRPV